MRWTLSALLLLQPAPTLCAPLADGTDASSLERVHALEMELKAERRKQESDRRKQESDRRKLAAKILELEGRLNAADRAHKARLSMPSSRSSSPATNDGAPSWRLAKSRTPSRTPTSPSHTVDALTFAAATGESAYCGARVPPTSRS